MAGEANDLLNNKEGSIIQRLDVGEGGEEGEDDVEVVGGEDDLEDDTPVDGELVGVLPHKKRKGLTLLMLLMLLYPYRHRPCEVWIEIKISFEIGNDVRKSIDYYLHVISSE